MSDVFKNIADATGDSSVRRGFADLFAVGMQMKILVGFGVLFLTISLLPGIASFIFTEMKKMMVLFIEGMY